MGAQHGGGGGGVEKVRASPSPGKSKSSCRWPFFSLWRVFMGLPVFAKISASAHASVIREQCVMML